MPAGEAQEVVQQTADSTNLVPAVSSTFMAAFPPQPLYAWPTEQQATVPHSSPLHSEEQMQGAPEQRHQELVDPAAGNFFVEDVSAEPCPPTTALPAPTAPIPPPVSPVPVGPVPAAAHPPMEVTPSPVVVSPAPAVPMVSLEDLRHAMQQFVAERDWDKFHAPRNLLLAMVGEVGELAEIFQWRGEVDKGLPGFNPEDKEHVSQELADILLYVVRLADVCGIDLGQAAYSKLHLNSQKYPAEYVRGSAAKYTTYSHGRNFEAPIRHKSEDEVGRKRQRERFSEEQVAAMTQLAERAGWSITAISWEERVKFCEEYGVTKERLSNFFNNRKPKDLKKGRNRTPGGGHSLQQTPSQPLHDLPPQVHDAVPEVPAVPTLVHVKMDPTVEGATGTANTLPPANDAQAQMAQAMNPPATA